MKKIREIIELTNGFKFYGKGRYEDRGKGLLVHENFYTGLEEVYGEKDYKELIDNRTVFSVPLGIGVFWDIKQNGKNIIDELTFEGGVQV